MLRVPPVQLLNDPADRGLPSQLASDYRTETKKFFQNYKPSDQDNLRVIENIINPQVYETLRFIANCYRHQKRPREAEKEGC